MPQYLPLTSFDFTDLCGVKLFMLTSVFLNKITIKFNSFSIVCFLQTLSKMLANCTNTGNRLVQVGVEDVSAMGVDELCHLFQKNVVLDSRLLEELRTNVFSFSCMVLLLPYVIC